MLPLRNALPHQPWIWPCDFLIFQWDSSSLTHSDSIRTLKKCEFCFLFEMPVIGLRTCPSEPAGKLWEIHGRNPSHETKVFLDQPTHNLATVAQITGPLSWSVDSCCSKPLCFREIYKQLKLIELSSVFERQSCERHFVSFSFQFY